MYMVKKFGINLMDLGSPIKILFESLLVPKPEKEESVEMEEPPIPKKCSDCMQDTLDVLKNVLTNEDVIFVLMMGTFLFSIILWTVTKWSKNRHEKAQKLRRMKKIQDRLRRTKNLSSILQNLSSEDEVEVAQENKKLDCDEEIEQPGNFEVIGDHPDPVPSRENTPEVIQTFPPPLDLTFQELSDSARTYSMSPRREEETTAMVSSAEIASSITPEEVETVRKELPAPEIPLTPTPTKRIEDSSERSSVKSRVSKINKLRVDPLEFRYKRMKKSPEDLNVAFGSRLATPRIGDFTCNTFPKSLSNQVSPTLSMSRTSLVRSHTNVSFTMRGTPPKNIPQKKTERPEAKGPEILSTSSSEASNSIKP